VAHDRREAHQGQSLASTKGPRYQDISKLGALGFTLMDEAKQHSTQEQSISLRTALAFRDGWIIALEAATLLRRRNLAR
jgi:hypothetical protein